MRFQAQKYRFVLKKKRQILIKLKRFEIWDGCKGVYCHICVDLGETFHEYSLGKILQAEKNRAIAEDDAKAASLAEKKRLETKISELELQVRTSALEPASNGIQVAIRS